MSSFVSRNQVKQQNTVMNFSGNDVAVEHSFFDIPLEKSNYTFPLELQTNFVNLTDLDKISFKDFLQLHHISPKIYMLKCDKDVDFSQDAAVLFEMQPHGARIRDHLIKRAKQRQIDNLMISAIQSKKSEFQTLQVSTSNRLKTADNKSSINGSQPDRMTIDGYRQMKAGESQPQHMVQIKVSHLSRFET